MKLRQRKHLWASSTLKIVEFTSYAKKHPGRVFEGANMTHVKYKVPRSVDNVHLNTEGYDMLGEETWQVLKNVFAKYKLDLAGGKAM